MATSTMAEVMEKQPQDAAKVEAQSTVVDTTVADRNLATEEDEYVPDGGREAWTVVMGSSLALFASAGMINAYVGPAVTCYILWVLTDED